MLTFDEKYTRFLLGNATPDEETEIALATLDDDLYDEMEFIEDDLISNYVRGYLSPAEVELFEANYRGSTTARDNRIIFTRAWLAKINRESKAPVPIAVVESKPAFISWWKPFAWGSVGGLVGIFAGYLVFTPTSVPVARDAERIRELESEQRAAAETIKNLEGNNRELSERINELSNSNPTIVKNTPDKNRPAPKPNDRLTKIPELVATEGVMSPVAPPTSTTLPPGTKVVGLTVPIGQLGPGRYDLTIGGGAPLKIKHKSTSAIRVEIRVTRLNNGPNNIKLTKLPDGPTNYYVVNIEKEE